MFDFNEVSVPENIDDYIKKGIESGIRKKKTNKVKLSINVAIISILTIFIVSVRTSPAFATYMARVPGLEYLVGLINYDKGLMNAVENNFIQKINTSVTKEGIKVTIKDLIIDNSQAIIFYSIDNEKDNKNIEIADVKITNEKGQDLWIGKSWGSSKPYKEQGDNRIEDRINIDFSQEDIFPETLFIEIRLRNSSFLDNLNYDESIKKSMLASSWNFKIPINKEKIKSMEKNFTLNQMISIENQKITFQEAKVTPTRIAVKVEYDKNNSKKILGYDDITIVDEKGETWGTWNFSKNGYSTRRIDENHEILYFQSNYFDIPKELYIKASSLRALDKDKLDVVVDLENSKLIKAPDEKLTLTEVEQMDKDTSISFSLKADKVLADKIGYYSFSSSYKDSNGNNYDRKLGKVYWEDREKDEKKIQVINFIIENNPKIKGPIHMELMDYPERISGDIKIRIK